jgi:hypothetical protein
MCLYDTCSSFPLQDVLVPAYKTQLESSAKGEIFAKEAMAKYEEIRLRGRKRTMVG